MRCHKITLMNENKGLFQAPPEIMEWFQRLTDKQLVEVFYQTVQGRRISGEGEDWHQEHLILVNASRTRDYLDFESGSEELGPWEPWELQLLAFMDGKYYPQGWDDESPICQMGRCSCNPHEILCYAKDTICPICGKSVYAT